MKRRLKKTIDKHAQKLRYGLVGGFNTALDFGLLFLLVHLGLPKIPSNFISTTVSFLVSFYANKKFTFKSDGNTKRQFPLFIVVTLFGLWVLQPIVIVLTNMVLEPYIDNMQLRLFIEKLLATGVTLVWNYFFYSRVIFKK